MCEFKPGEDESIYFVFCPENPMRRTTNYFSVRIMWIYESIIYRYVGKTEDREEFVILHYGKISNSSSIGNIILGCAVNDKAFDHLNMGEFAEYVSRYLPAEAGMELARALMV